MDGELWTIEHATLYKTNPTAGRWQQVGKKGKSNRRWIVGLKLCWLVNDCGEVVAWEAFTDEDKTVEFRAQLTNIKAANPDIPIIVGGPFATINSGSDKDWDWCMGVNFWGPLYGVRTFVPRMLAHKEGSHIVTTSSTDGVLLGTTGIYAVSKMAVSGLMEQLRHELRATNIGTSNLVPGQTSTNIGRSETYRPESMKNDAPPPARPAGLARPPGAARPPAPQTTPLWARPQDPLTVGRLVVNGIINNDMWIYPAPEYRVGVEARGMAMTESMVDFSPMPEHIAAGRDRYYRTPIYVQEVAHRRATRKRNIPGV